MIKPINIKPLSVNYAWQGRRYKTPEYKQFERDLLALLPDLQIPKQGDLQIKYCFGFSNKQADWDNPIKPVTDILQKRYGFNDNRIVRALIEKRIVKKGDEFVWFDIQPV